ncbi:hypothetical protein HU200_039180 [Digitaria exilis]|uniref:Uncharacterized protein n=1 Tax=Digitaria exilis TaxID=1010633 RepID=A0A835BDH5_9POAL|nr:hypothetical protein HU200_039180 [Digitaria exilis]
MQPQNYCHHQRVAVLVTGARSIDRPAKISISGRFVRTAPAADLSFWARARVLPARIPSLRVVRTSCVPLLGVELLVHRSQGIHIHPTVTCCRCPEVSPWISRLDPAGQFSSWQKEASFVSKEDEEASEQQAKATRKHTSRLSVSDLLMAGIILLCQVSTQYHSILIRALAGDS